MFIPQVLAILFLLSSANSFVCLENANTTVIEEFLSVSSIQIHPYFPLLGISGKKLPLVSSPETTFLSVYSLPSEGLLYTNYFDCTDIVSIVDLPSIGKAICQNSRTNTSRLINISSVQSTLDTNVFLNDSTVYSIVGDGTKEFIGGEEVLTDIKYNGTTGFIIPSPQVYSGTGGGVIIGGSGRDGVSSMAMNSTLLVAVGSTTSPNFLGSTVPAVSYDAFVVGYNIEQSANSTILPSDLVFSIVFGGPSLEIATDVKIDADGVYITGITLSPTFNGTTEGNHGARDIFVTKLTSNGLKTRLIGGRGHDRATHMAITNDSIIIVGSTNSEDFPDFYSSCHANATQSDVIMVILDKETLEITDSRCLSSPGNDSANSVDINERNGNIYIVGAAAPGKFPGVTNGQQAGGAFVTKFQCFYGTCPRVSCYGKCVSELSSCSYVCPHICPNGTCVKNESLCDSNCAQNNCTKAPFENLPYQAQVPFNPFENSLLPFAGSAGTLGTVYIQSGTVTDGTTLSIDSVPVSTLSTLAYPLSNLGVNGILSTVVNLKIGSNEHNNFDTPVTLTFNVTIPQEYENARICLAYLKEADNAWECVDSDLVKNSDNTYSGKTTHFSSFAVLLTGENENSDSNSESRSKGVGLEVILPVVIVAAVIVIAGAIASIVIAKKNKKQEDNALALDEHATPKYLASSSDSHDSN